LLGRGGSVLEDRLNHASLLDGARLSGARLKRYRHADIDGLEAMLSVAGSSVMIATDGVFSMDGDIAPVDAISAAAAQYGALLLVDDAHGLGVIGAKGGGVTEFFGLNQQQVPILIGTLGKAFGTFGAFAAGPEALIETLIQKARTYIYTTALPPAVAAATLISLTIAERETWRRDKLAASIERFRQGALQLGLNLFPSVTPIQPVLLGDNRRTLEAGRQLLEAGFLVGSIRPPTVPQGGARLRITLSAVHCEQHVDRLLDALAALAA
ncbi:MAG: aminotransferase class I/II-fold pyridoxal phosphate-dependent enzyme, partial [Gammaproteobacteria bacterium]